MLVPARNVSLVLDLECLHRAADIHVCRSLYRISHSDIADNRRRLLVVHDRSGTRYKVSDVQFVAHIFLNIHQKIIWMAKLQRDGLSALGPFVQWNQEKA
jgi:hypothetical protein